jgi:hypothetical protein
VSPEDKGLLQAAGGIGCAYTLVFAIPLGVIVAAIAAIAWILTHV